MKSHSPLHEPILLSDDIENGGKDESMGGMENDFALQNNVHNASVKIRMAFIRKVYGLLSVQLLITVAIAAVFFAEPVKLYVSENVWPVATTFFATFGLLIALHFKRREHPINLILLGGFTILEACLIGIIVSVFDVMLVLQAVFLTLTVVGALTGFTFQTKRDFTAMGAGLFAALWVLILGGLLQIFILSSVMEAILAIGGAIIFSFFIIYDTQMLMQKLSPEEYILATINIYLDIINLFLEILRILAIFRK